MTTDVCPSCGGCWWMDIEPDTGNPYTCYTCCNGSITKFEKEEDHGSTIENKKIPTEIQRYNSEEW